VAQAERFTRWNEPKSGINPFVPHRRKWPHNLVGRCVKGVVGLALAVLRLPIVLVLFACLAVTSLLMKLVRVLCGLTPSTAPVCLIESLTLRQVYVKALQRLLKFLLESPLCYLSLLFLGFYSPRSTVVDRRRVHLAYVAKASRLTLLYRVVWLSGSLAVWLVGVELANDFSWLRSHHNARREDKKSKRSKNPRGGDLIIANSSSFVDILYMGYRYCGVGLATARVASDAFSRSIQQVLPHVCSLHDSCTLRVCGVPFV